MKFSVLFLRSVNTLPVSIESGQYYTLKDLTPYNLPYSGGPNNEHELVANVREISQIQISSSGWTTVCVMTDDGTVTQLASGNVGTTTYNVANYSWLTVVAVSGGLITVNVSVIS